MVCGVFVLLVLAALVPSMAAAQGRPGVNHRRGERHVRRRAAGRDRRSIQPGADRKDPLRGHRRHRSVPDRRSAAPGTYTVTFTLTGFSTVKREGIELTGSFTATINADMKVGARRGNHHRHRRDADRRHRRASRRQTTISNDVINAIPTARGVRGHHDADAVPVTTQPAPRTSRSSPGDGRVRRRRRTQATKAACSWTASTSGRRSTAAACRRTSPTSATRRKSR